MTNIFKDQEKFMQACDQTVGEFNEKQYQLYCNLIAEEFNELMAKQRQNIASEEDIIRTTKAIYKYNLGVDILNENIMKCYYRKDHTVRNFINLINLNSEINSDTQHGEEKKIKLEIVRNIITLLGWKSGTDDRVINKDDFDLGIMNLIGKSTIFTDQKMAKIYFDMSKSKIDTTNSKYAIKYINEFLKHYSLKIDVGYDGKRVEKNKIFKLVELHNVSEIVEYLVNSKQYEPFHGMRKPKEYLFRDCLSVKNIPKIQYLEKIELDFD
jgi:hypothetical protein